MRDEQFDARAIPQGQYSQPATTVRKNSWPKAVWLSVTDDKKLLSVLVMRVASIFIAGDSVATVWNIANDFLFPVAGFADEPLLLGEVPIGVLLAYGMYRKAKQYRYSSTTH